ncbi:MAG: preprotein translocase subunit SecG [bacterium]|uniref:Protein-export membrane protein SecG n=1 Tax=candidate division WOR-3 bacterium TaxID=2052148 RepID=A0A348MJ19_UNCW3|nr:MAG: Preprotein translocase, SecG subunit [candidate division TA06 bacterium 32_111]MDI6700916.1 preprotein translocase subunit SecG [bacterium]HAF07045.1 preprotein translocase subunit SecG [candidate division WOR-3 bacterium]
MFTLILIIHILVSVLLVVLILLQQSKGGMSEMFGGGGQENLLSGFGTENILTKTTAILAVVFMLTSFSLAIMTSKVNRTPQIEKKVPIQNNIPQSTPEQNTQQPNPTIPLNNLPTNEGGK